MNTRSVLSGLAACTMLCAIPGTACARIFPMIFETNRSFGGQVGDEPLAAGTGTVGMYDSELGLFDPAFVQNLHGPVGIVVSQPFPSAPVIDLFVVNNATGTIGKYVLDPTGTIVLSINPALITGLHGPAGIAVSGGGGELFVANQAKGTIGAYSIDGRTVNASLIKGLHGPVGIAVSGDDLFVANHAKGTIGEYTLSGATVNANLITGLKGPEDIAVLGGNLFVTNFSSGTVGEYTTSGVTVDSDLISELHGPQGIATFQDEHNNQFLFIVNHGNGTVGEYSASGGPGFTLISGLHGPQGIALLPVEVSGCPNCSVPDRSFSWLLLLLGFIATFGLRLILRQPA
jgi:DNA-binding beta-propeller fold protein YncE